ncbi:MAG: hypothetical protein JO022_22200 [Acidobacteriaceae bacterium]|nr:hypothetical protein [Acidobacteriaceae bacterium]
MRNNDLLTKVGYGALAGVAGALAIYASRSLYQNIGPNGARRFAEAGEQARSLLPKLPQPLESAGSGLLSWAYGSTGRAIYTALRSDPEVFVDGAALGAALWAAGYFGWLPALGFGHSERKNDARQIASSVAQHVLFGIATVGSFRNLKHKAAA